MRRLIRECANTFRFLFGFDRKQDQLDDELQFHIEQAIEERVAAGQSFEEARRETLREFGNIERAKEECREAWGLRSLHNFRRDVSYSLRRMRHEKGFATVVSLTFALGIGLNTMIFSLFNSLWLNPGLYPDENRIVRIYESYAEGAAIGNPHERGTSPHFYIERSEQSELAEAIAITFPHNGTITGEGMTPEYLSFWAVSPSLLSVFGVTPIEGRWFTKAESQFGNDNVVVLSFDYWSTRFNADPNAVGKTIFTDGQPRTIIGVMPEDFRVPEAIHVNDGMEFEAQRMIFVPFEPRNSWVDTPDRRHVTWCGSFARLKLNVTPDQLQEELNVLNERNGANYPDQFAYEQRHQHRTLVTSIKKDLLRSNRTFLFLLQGALAFVLMIGCVNIVSLVLSRNSARQQEFSIRIALGAGTRRVATQLVTEVWILAAVGGTAGLFLAMVGLRIFDAIGTFKFFLVPPRLGMDTTVFAFAFILSSVAGIASGLASLLPLLRNRKNRSAIEEDSRTGSAGREAKTFRATLLATEIVFTVILLVGSGLLLRSFTKIVRIDPGYQTESLMTGVVRLPQNRYDEPGTKRFITDFEQRLQTLPGVKAAGITNWPPLKISATWEMHFIRPGDDYLDGDNPTCSSDAIGIHYFDALDIPLRKGRVFAEADYQENAAVAVIDQRIADTHFPSEDPIGQLIAVPFKHDPLNPETSLRWLRVIGVVQPIRNDNLLDFAAVGGTVYQTYQQQVPYWIGLVISSEDDPALLLKPIRDLLSEMEPMAALALTESMSDSIKRRYSHQQTFLVLIAAISGVALIISSVGVYGMLAHSVSIQSKEISIRRALGADDKAVFGSILKYWLKAAAMGLGIGVIGALLASHFLESVLYETRSTDPVSYISAIALLSLTIMVAAFQSAKKAVSLNILESLRN